MSLKYEPPSEPLHISMQAFAQLQEPAKSSIFTVCLSLGPKGWVLVFETLQGNMYLKSNGSPQGLPPDTGLRQNPGTVRALNFE